MKPEFEHWIETASAPFLKKRSLYYYARSKMRTDPAYRTLAGFLRESGEPILDLGCGAGVFASFLRSAGIFNPLFGCDLDRAKIDFAREFVAPRWTGLSFAHQNAAAVSGFSGNVVGLDLLHYFADTERADLLRNLCSMVSPSGKLFLRNGIRDAGWRHWVTNAEELVVRSSRWIVGGEWNFPSRSEVEEILRSCNLRVVTVPMWQGTPFSSVLFVAARDRKLL